MQLLACMVQWLGLANKHSRRMQIKRADYDHKRPHFSASFSQSTSSKSTIALHGSLSHR
jgi:hypothetical protein